MLDLDSLLEGSGLVSLPDGRLNWRITFDPAIALDPMLYCIDGSAPAS